MRTLFRKNNYKVFLVDEFRSSCRATRILSVDLHRQKIKKKHCALTT